MVKKGDELPRYGPSVYAKYTYVTADNERHKTFLAQTGSEQ